MAKRRDERGDCFTAEIDGGAVRIHGSAKAYREDPEFREALEAIVRATKEMAARGELPGRDGLEGL